MVSDFAAEGESISETGYHVGVAIEDGGQTYVFDNFANGVPYSEWANGLNAPNGVSVNLWGAW
jgi:energy-converting hydrogenase Eha subunit G